MYTRTQVELNSFVMISRHERITGEGFHVKLHLSFVFVEPLFNPFTGIIVGLLPYASSLLFITICRKTLTLRLC